MPRTLNDGDHIETIVIGGGQAGLAVGNELSARGREFVILDANRRIGDAWRNRWDSLLVFTPARYDGLPGMKFPAKGDTFVDKDGIADYLESYAHLQELPVHLGVEVTRLGTAQGRYAVEIGDRTLYADNVVVAMADNQDPRVPSFAPDLDYNIVQLHSAMYRNPSQLQDGAVLIVGMGNSGADIGIEVAKVHKTYLAGKESAHIPFRIEPWFGRNVMVRLVRFAMVRVLNTSTPIGKKVRPNMLGKAAPLVRVKPKDLEAVTERVGRVVGVRDGKPELDDGTLLDVNNVIWCTGFKPGFEWVDLPVFDEAGRIETERGVVPSHPGLYFVGHFFLHSVWSETLTGMVRDARYVINHLDSRVPAISAIA